MAQRTFQRANSNCYAAECLDTAMRDRPAFLAWFDEGCLGNVRARDDPFELSVLPRHSRRMDL